MARIDNTDMKILNELAKDSNLSVPKLSKKINMNASVVYSRIKRLIKRNLIKRFTIEVNDESLGYVVSATVGMNIQSRHRDMIIKELEGMNEVREVAEVTGRFDLIVRVKTHSLDELHQVVSNKLGRLDGVQHTETFIEMKYTALEPDYSTLSAPH